MKRRDVLKSAGLLVGAGVLPMLKYLPAEPVAKLQPKLKVPTMSAFDAMDGSRPTASQCAKT